MTFIRQNLIFFLLIILLGSGILFTNTLLADWKVDQVGPTTIIKIACNNTTGDSTSFSNLSPFTEFTCVNSTGPSISFDCNDYGPGGGSGCNLTKYSIRTTNVIDNVGPDPSPSTLVPSDKTHPNRLSVLPKGQQYSITLRSHDTNAGNISPAFVNLRFSNSTPPPTSICKGQYSCSQIKGSTYCNDSSQKISVSKDSNNTCTLSCTTCPSGQQVDPSNPCQCKAVANTCPGQCLSTTQPPAGYQYRSDLSSGCPATTPYCYVQVAQNTCPGTCGSSSGAPDTNGSAEGNCQASDASNGWWQWDQKGANTSSNCSSTTLAYCYDRCIPITNTSQPPASSTPVPSSNRQSVTGPLLWGKVFKDTNESGSFNSGQILGFSDGVFAQPTVTGITPARPSVSFYTPNLFRGALRYEFTYYGPIQGGPSYLKNYSYPPASYVKSFNNYWKDSLTPAHLTYTPTELPGILKEARKTVAVDNSQRNEITYKQGYKQPVNEVIQARKVYQETGRLYMYNAKSEPKVCSCSQYSTTDCSSEGEAGIVCACAQYDCMDKSTNTTYRQQGYTLLNGSCSGSSIALQGCPVDKTWFEGFKAINQIVQGTYLISNFKIEGGDLRTGPTEGQGSKLFDDYWTWSPCDPSNPYCECNSTNPNDGYYCPSLPAKGGPNKLLPPGEYSLKVPSTHPLRIDVYATDPDGTRTNMYSGTATPDGSGNLNAQINIPQSVYGKTLNMVFTTIFSDPNNLPPVTIGEVGLYPTGIYEAFVNFPMDYGFRSYCMSGLNITNKPTSFPQIISTRTTNNESCNGIFTSNNGNSYTISNQTTTVSANQVIRADFLLGNNGSINAKVFSDNNANGIKEPSEQYLSGIRVSATGATSQTQTSDTSGNVSFINLARGTYTLALPPTPGYRVSTTGSYTLTLPPSYTVNNNCVVANTPGCFGLTPLLSVAGNILELVDGRLVSTTLAGNVRITGPTTGNLTAGAGNYNVAGLYPGSYTVTFTPPAGYNIQGQSSYNFTVGSGCAAPSGNGSCINGSVSNLNFVVTKNLPRVETSGGDVHTNTNIN